ncbi:MAG: hypothetical protein U1F13_02940 [Acinetobacter parvus]
MGSKRLSKIAMIDAGVPCVPGYEGDQQEIEYLAEQAENWFSIDGQSICWWWWTWYAFGTPVG